MRFSIFYFKIQILKILLKLGWVVVYDIVLELTKCKVELEGFNAYNLLIKVGFMKIC